MFPRVISTHHWPRPFLANRAYGPPMSLEKRSQFWQSSVELVQLELASLGATQITLCTGHRTQGARKIHLGEDGWPTDNIANALATHPGVQLAFLCEYGWMHFLCDAFQQWEVNFRCIGETLEHLSGINMLKMLDEGQIYAPFRVSNNPFASNRSYASEQDDESWSYASRDSWRDETNFESDIPSTVPDRVVIAATWMAARSSISLSTILQTEDGLKKAYREIARKLHPDVEGGKHESFVQLGQYLALIEKYQQSNR